MRKLKLVLLGCVLFLASCNNQDEVICYAIELDGIETSCNRCWDNQDDYNEWFNRCWVYSLVEDKEKAIDLLCNCD